MDGRELRHAKVVALTVLLLACRGSGVLDATRAGVERTVIAVGDGPSAVTLADVDGDGDLDAVVANQGDDDLQLLIGDGRGGLSPRGRTPAGENPDNVAAADVDGDGDVDLAVSNHETDHVTVLLGDGNGAFEAAPWSPVRVAVDPHPHTVRLTDLDGDGGIDLLIDDRGGRGYRVLPWSGETGFGPGEYFVDVEGDPYLGVAIADLDGDGRDDLVTPIRTAVAVVLQRTDGDGFRRPELVPMTRPFAVGLGDLTADGILDLVVAESPGPVWVLQGTGDGGFVASDDPVGDLPGEAKAIAIGDFDGDGIDDAAVAGFESPELLLLFGGARGIERETVTAGESPWGIAAGDLDGDGRDELLVTDYANGALDLFRMRAADSPDRAGRAGMLASEPGGSASRARGLSTPSQEHRQNTEPGPADEESLAGAERRQAEDVQEPDDHHDGTDDSDHDSNPVLHPFAPFETARRARSVGHDARPRRSSIRRE